MHFGNVLLPVRKMSETIEEEISSTGEPAFFNILRKGFWRETKTRSSFCGSNSTDLINTNNNSNKNFSRKVSRKVSLATFDHSRRAFNVRRRASLPENILTDKTTLDNVDARTSQVQ